MRFPVVCTLPGHGQAQSQIETIGGHPCVPLGVNGLSRSGRRSSGCIEESGPVVRALSRSANIELERTI